VGGLAENCGGGFGRRLKRGSVRNVPTEAESKTCRVELLVEGAIQGVGFRPHVYRLARELGLQGGIGNTLEGAFIEVEGAREALEVFVARLESAPPVLARIERVAAQWGPPRGFTRFEIRPSDASGNIRAEVLPDIATCPECLRELLEPSNRRFGYPFTNCTHCGPRFSIIERLPYDRPNTSMKGFAFCVQCRAEYEDPEDRRFHAQPIACPDCGPQLALWDSSGQETAARDAALLGAAAAIRAGQIVAVKGLGGFHLLVNAADDAAVARLRERKSRDEKPLALMLPSLESVRGICEVSEFEAGLLSSAEGPIVLLTKLRDQGPIAEDVAPGMREHGVMLPYTPLHHLLVAAAAVPLVATSGNRSDEPICTDEHEALARLQGIADLFLVHNRPIVRHVDDSIVRVINGREMLLRRARGFAPQSERLLGANDACILAFGAHQKNTVALAKAGKAILSQHLGDLDSLEAVTAFERAGEDLQVLFDAQPVAVACDLHPDYASTAHARRQALPVYAVQHHYAHVLSCMAENRLDGLVLGVSWDGTGYGPDGTVWGGEFFKADMSSYGRFAAFYEFPLAGGERAVKEPRRAALGVLHVLYGDELPDTAATQSFSSQELATLQQMMAKDVNAPRSSSAGRLFDAVAALCGLRQHNAFEGHAAMLLESAAEGEHRRDTRYGLICMEQGGVLRLDWRPAVRTLVEDVAYGRSVQEVAACFHYALAEGIVAVALRAGLEDVVLTGGCFQNKLLSELATMLLEQSGFHVHTHRRIPPNDGGIAVGQAVYALRQCRARGV